MPFFFKVYIALWGTALLSALVMIMRWHTRMILCRPTYRNFLFRPWKLGTFFVAALAFIVAAPYTVDPTWDYWDAGFMSLLTYATAPWAVGVLYRARKHSSHHIELFPAICLWLFSASWSYDLYILLRDGIYPDSWLANLSASSILYLLAGMFWNLDWTEQRGTTFAFLNDEWPVAGQEKVFGKILWVGMLFMLFIGVMFLSFLDF